MYCYLSSVMRFLIYMQEKLSICARMTNLYISRLYGQHILMKLCCNNNFMHILSCNYNFMQDVLYIGITISSVLLVSQRLHTLLTFRTPGGDMSLFTTTVWPFPSVLDARFNARPNLRCNLQTSIRLHGSNRIMYNMLRVTVNWGRWHIFGWPYVASM